MERLRGISSLQRFALMLLGIVLGNVGRLALDGILGDVVIVIGATASLTALGLVELAVWIWDSLHRRFTSVDASKA